MESPRFVLLLVLLSVLTATEGVLIENGHEVVNFSCTDNGQIDVTLMCIGKFSNINTSPYVVIRWYDITGSTTRKPMVTIDNATNVNIGKAYKGIAKATRLSSERLDGSINLTLDANARSVRYKVFACDLQVLNDAPSVYNRPVFAYSLCYGVADTSTAVTGVTPSIPSTLPDPLSTIDPAVVPVLGTSNSDSRFEDVRFECSFDQNTLDPGLYVDITWKTPDRTLKKYTNLSLSSLPESAHLPGKTLGFTPGDYLQCGVQVSRFAWPTPGQEYVSSYFFTGIKRSPSYVYVREGKSVEVSIRFALPVPCRKDRSTPCRVHFRGTVQPDTPCGRVVVDSFDITRNNWNKDHSLTIKTSKDGKHSFRSVRVRLTGELEGIEPNSLWNNMASVEFKVHIDGYHSDYSSSVCTVTSDPHIHTFDGRRFDVHLPGEFVLFRHKALPIEVRGFFQRCTRSSDAHCVCGIAVRSGSQLHVSSSCRDANEESERVTRTRTYGCEKQQMTVLGNGDRIGLPTGISVTYSPHYITIRPYADAPGQTEGLCGNNNGDPKDDLIGPTGERFCPECDAYLFPPDIFCILNRYGSTWRVTDRSRSYYGYPSAGLPGFCDGPVPEGFDCQNPLSQSCVNPNGDLDLQFCVSSTFGRRRKREISDDDGLNDDDGFPPFPLTEDPSLESFAWRNGWTEQKARAHCARFFSDSPAREPCSEVLSSDIETSTVDDCVADIKLSGVAEYSIIALENFKEKCLTEAEKNTTLFNNGSADSLYKKVMENSCPGECSFHGSCVKGVCQCNADWLGDDCSVSKATPPDVIRLPFGGVCNLEKRTCRRTVVYGYQFVPNDSLRCQFDQLTVLEEGGLNSSDSGPFVTQGTFRLSSEVVCTLPPTAPVGTLGGRPVVYNLSVSNYGNEYGAAKLFLPVRPQDWTCDIVNQTVECSKTVTDKRSSCIKPPVCLETLLILCVATRVLRCFV